jgi:hypothetical protein
MNDDNTSCIAETQVRRIKLSNVLETLPLEGAKLLCLVVETNFVPPWFKREDAEGDRCGSAGAIFLVTFNQLSWALVNCYAPIATSAVLGETLAALQKIRTEHGGHHTLRIDVLS